MLAPAPRGRIIAMELLSILPTSPLSAQWMIAVKTTRFDDGHVIAWHVQQDEGGRCWPTKVRLDPSLLYSSHSEEAMKAMGIAKRWSLALGSVPMCLDDLESICLRSSLPDAELGEDHGSWCLDILFKLERRQILVKDQALCLEAQVASQTATILNPNTCDSQNAAELPPSNDLSPDDKNYTSDASVNTSLAYWPRTRSVSSNDTVSESHSAVPSSPLSFPTIPPPPTSSLVV
ncbi:hypothetical protein MPSI1_001596 [Malassezia psittaci]|uniref:Uncharacterized protein n=1 Tax=Malassezia psittaci TaxID=1821823 RepID=A0AAF0JDY7_9BASI|nr:hypothetical protein MPSI1_001596 [Malassezia psittaci]